MSYLLTEIALEMMGYKYYDIDGAFGPTNFKHTAATSAGSSEPSLGQILEYSSDTEEATATTTAVDANNENANASDPVPSTAAANVEEVAAAAAPPTSSSSLPQPPTSGALVRLLDYEFRRIREQVERNQTLYVQAHTDQLKRMEQRNGCTTPQEFLQPYVDSERRNLQREVHTMHAFRKITERNLVKMNPENFEKYMNTFRRNKRALEKMTQPKQQKLDGHVQH